MGQHKPGSAGIPCSGALKSPALSVVVPVSPGAEPAQNLSPAVQTPGQQKTLALPPSSPGFEPHSFFFFLIYFVCARSLLLQEDFLQLG